MAKHQDLCFQRGSRSEKSDQPAPDQPTEPVHRAEDQPIRCLWPIVLGLRQGQATINAKRKAHGALCASLLTLGLAVITVTPVVADEGGVSFWVPGFVGSLAATPQVPGFSFANILYYSQVSAGGNVAFAKQVPLGNINVNFNGNLNANVNGSAEPLYLAIPGYTFATPLLGGQAAVILGMPYGRLQSSVSETITGNLSLGGPGFSIGRGLTESVTGIGDLVPQASLRWNLGVNNFMTYITGNLTTGLYAARAQIMSKLLPEQQFNVGLIIHHQNKQVHVRAPDAESVRGRMTRNSVNSPGLVSTSIKPPCCFTTMS